MLRGLDRGWITQLLSQVEPALSSQFWFSESGCLWASRYGAGAQRSGEVVTLAEEIARRHGPECFVVDQNIGLVIFPERAAEKHLQLWQQLNT
jgi:hypothetical protein